ncbi:MAG: hypothetical protein JW838_10430 [Spirochaetes bacterium]|nr:hypothetical protein [Spirochaetota bacterium]
MIIPLSKLLVYGSNKYIFTRACMDAVEKIGNMRKYPQDETKWKVVPHILKLTLEEDVKFHYRGEGEEE